MKILLLNAPTDNCEALVPPLGICYIAAVLREKHEVKLIDLDLEKDKMNYLGKIIANLRPRTVMISALTPEVENAYYIAKIVKSVDKETIVIIGGPHASALQQRTLEECKDIDIVVTGEGENIAKEICEIIENDGNFLKNIQKNLKGIKNIGFRKNDKVFLTKKEIKLVDVDALPLPARDLLKFNKYQGWGPKKGNPSTHIIASRGCPFNCVFCSEKVVFGRGNRRRSPKKVVDEIEILKNKYKVKEFSFYDDLFTANKQWVKEVCEEIIRRKINLPWKSLSRVDTIDLETLKLMKKAGCWLIFYGYESGSNEILKNINKMTSIEQGLKATAMTKQVGIKIFGFFMIGNIGETKKTIKETVKYIKKVSPDYTQIAIVRPDPGSPQYFQYKDELEKKHTSWKDYYAFHKDAQARLPIVGTDLTLDELIIYKEIGRFYSSKKTLFLNLLRNLIFNTKHFPEMFKKIYLPALSEKKFNQVFDN